MKKLIALLALLAFPSVANATFAVGTGSVSNPVPVNQGGTGITSLTGSLCVRSASTTALAEAAGDCLTTAAAVTIGQGGTGQTTANAGLNALLPSQTGHANGFLQTDGTNTSWVAGASGVTAVTATAPILSSGGTTPVISMSPSPVFSGTTFSDQFTAGGTTATGSATGDATFARSATTGKIWVGSNGSSYIDFGITNAGAWRFIGGTINAPGFSAGTSSLSGTAAQTAKMNQSAADKWGTRHALSSGSYTFTFPVAYTSTPVCIATGESSTVNLLDVTPSTTSCIVTSSSGVDTQVVDIIVLGDPN